MPKSDEVHRLNDEAWSYRETDRDKAKELATQALVKAKKCNDETEIMLARLTLAQVANFRMELEEAQEQIDYVSHRITERSPQEVVVRFYHQQCFLHYQRNQFSNLIEVGHKMLELINDDGFVAYRSWILSTMGMAYQRLGNGNLALESYRKAEQVYTESENVGALSNIRMSMGTALAELGRRSEALKMFEESLTARLSVGGDFHAGIILANIAKVQSQLGEHSKAILRWNEATAYLKRAGGMPLWAQAMAGCADSLRQLNRLQEAEDLLNEALDQSQQFPAPILVEMYFALARVHAAAKRWDQTILTLELANQKMDAEGNGLSQWVELHREFYNAYRAKGEPESALHHHEKMVEFKDKHLNDTSVTKLAEWEALYQMERLRKNQEKLRIKTAELEDILTSSSKEKRTLLDQLASYDVLIDEMLESLPSERKDRFTRLVRSVRNTNVNEHADKLVQNRISEKHPDLTPTELRVCLMLAYGWTTKEMSDRSGTSMKTIEKHRTAIRRKTAIPRSVSLQVYLSGIAKIA